MIELGIGLVLLVLLGLVVVLVGWAIVTYNSLVGLRNQLDNAWAQIDVQLKRRYDLIPNLVEAVKDYMGFEQDVLTKVTEARSQAAAATGPADQARAENVLTGALRQLFAVVENYPQLKANENVMRLQEELTGTEDRISSARQFYNENVRVYNTRVQTFPTALIAGVLGFRAREFFATGDDAEREPVKVDLR
ncbi:MAG TPA: LemA family protein [Gemmatimonadota bacterium]|jgi:LemA protein|nr:LemA family protein [Gemmatimonadota bacterium]